jgi:hypothetical protein
MANQPEFIATWVSPYWKAVAGSLLAFLASLQAATDDGIAAGEWIAAAIAALLALGVVYAVPNITRNVEQSEEESVILDKEETSESGTTRSIRR